MPRPASIPLQQTQIAVLRTVDDLSAVVVESSSLDCSRPCFPPCEIVIDLFPPEGNIMTLSFLGSKTQNRISTRENPSQVRFRVLSVPILETKKSLIRADKSMTDLR